MPQTPAREVQFQPTASGGGAGAMVEVIRLAELRQRELDHWLYGYQRRDFHIIQVVTAGRGRHNFEFGSIRLQQGDVFHIRPGQVDWFDEGSDHDAFLLLFLPEAVSDQSTLRSRLQNPLQPSAEDFARLEDLVQLIERFQTAVSLRESTLHLLQSFVSAFDRLHAEAASATRSPAKTTLCERFDELLADNQRRHRNVAWYANKLDVSAKTLARATDAVLGRTPKQHIDFQVLLDAKRMLVHSRDTVETIATQLGFSEPTNFVKFFRRREGGTPQKFRERFRA